MQQNFSCYFYTHNVQIRNSFTLITYSFIHTKKSSLKYFFFQKLFTPFFQHAKCNILPQPESSFAVIVAKIITPIPNNRVNTLNESSVMNISTKSKDKIRQFIQVLFKFIFRRSNGYLINKTTTSSFFLCQLRIFLETCSFPKLTVLKKKPQMLNPGKIIFFMIFLLGNLIFFYYDTS